MAGWITLLNTIIATKNEKERTINRQNLISSSHYFNEKSEFYLDDLFYNSESKLLNFNLVRKTTKPKITRYITQNYERTPIYGDISISTKIIKKFNKIINPIKFLEEDILNLPELNYKLILEIINKIGIIPKWREKEAKLEEIENQLQFNANRLRNFEKEKRIYFFDDMYYSQVQGKFWLRLFFAFFTFGLSFIGYTTKAAAEEGKNLNQEISEKNKKHEIEVDKYNKNLLKTILDFNEEINKENSKLAEKYEKIQKQEVQVIKVIDDNWIDLREASNFSYEHLDHKKGVYIIWNKTKNIYYVGQSKNMKQRLSNHFKNGTVNNITFAKDWYENDDFYYKYFFCDTKDELDETERKYIQLYNSFENGYNKTGGNL